MMPFCRSSSPYFDSMSMYHADLFLICLLCQYDPRSLLSGRYKKAC